jgi:hypothetical protein
VINVGDNKTDGITAVFGVDVDVVEVVGALRQRNPLLGVCLHTNGTGTEITRPTFVHTLPGAGCGLASTAPPANITPIANTAATTTRFKRLITLSCPALKQPNTDLCIDSVKKLYSPFREKTESRTSLFSTHCLQGNCPE